MKTSPTVKNKANNTKRQCEIRQSNDHFSQAVHNVSEYQ